MNFAVIGNPISHSKSPDFFNSFFEKEGLNYTYKAIKLSCIEDLIGIISDNNDLYGFNVTSPFKRQIIDLLDCIGDEVLQLNAVNVVRIERNQDNEYKLYGYNTDCLALYDIFKSIGLDNNKKVLIFGTGGASSAVSWALSKLCLDYVLVSRKESPDTHNVISYSKINKTLLENVSLIVNATPLGLDGISYPDIDYALLSSNHICFDLNYNPPITPFLAKSSERGATIINGYRMFELQAMKSWEIWNSNTIESLNENLYNI